MDFSTKTELRFLSELTAAFRVGAGDIPFFLAGATARDLLLHHAYGIDTGRKTHDVDLALMVPDWATYETIREHLIASGKFSADTKEKQHMTFDNMLPIDLIPFGAIEKDERSIAWPPEGDFVMNVLGFEEAYANTQVVQLPDGEHIHTVSLPALAVLKLFAWKERRFTKFRSDAHDLHVILVNYLDAGNHDRLYTDAAHLLDEPDFDYTLASAFLLGQDMHQLLATEARDTLIAL
jgi:predicted nucleotidyltransferase